MLNRPLLRGLRGACACGHPLGAAAAQEAFLAGGTAVDAAVAAAFALSVVLPEACGLGGEAMILIAPAGAPAVALNGVGRAPAALPDGPVPADGGGTVAVPAAAAAWLLAVERHGRLEREQVLAPARRLAREGVPAGVDTIAALAQQRPRLERSAPGFAFLAGDLRPGSRVVQPALAGVLDGLAADGAAALHSGMLGEAIARAVQADGGSMSAADVAAHATQVGTPVTGRRLGLDLAVSPPRSQATLALMALGVLDRHPTAPGAQRIHLGVEALEAAFVHRAALQDDAAARELLEVALDVDPDRAAGRGGPRAYSHTTAITCADADGTVVSMLISVFDDFGSAVLVPEGGFLLNSRLLGFTEAPNHPRGGEPPISTLAPVLIEDDGRRMGLATPGADGQVQTVLQVCALLADGAALPDALAAPRFRAEEGRLLLEEGQPPGAAQRLRAKGHDVAMLPAGDGRFGAVATAGVDEATGSLFAAADPRRETWALVL